MQLSQILASADFFHDYAKYSQRERRQLYGNVFGTGMFEGTPSPMLSQMHLLTLSSIPSRTSSICYLSRHAWLRSSRRWFGGLNFATSSGRFATPSLAASASRLCVDLWDNLDACDGHLVHLFIHRLECRGLFHFQHVRVSLPSFLLAKLVNVYIASCLRAIQIGWLCIQCFKFSQGNDADRSVSAASTSVRKLCKILHGLFMMYSLIMLLGAGISFPFRYLIPELLSRRSINC